MKTFTTHLQTMILMVLFAFATVQKANASAKAGEASVYEGSTVTISINKKNCTKSNLLNGAVSNSCVVCLNPASQMPPNSMGRDISPE